MNPESLARLEPLLLVWVALVGACVGSFLNVCIFRMPRECMTVFRPQRSLCTRCGRTLRWWDNVPLISWLVLRGRCAGCGTPISVRYPLVEALTMGAFAWLGWRLIPGHVGELSTWGVLLIHTSFASALIVCAGTDLDYRVIPDEVDVPGLVLAPLAMALVPAALPYGPPDLGALGDWLHELFASPLHWWGLDGLAASLDGLQSCSPHLSAFCGSLLGAGLGAGFIYGVGVTFSWVLGPKAMGFGDVKLMGMIGAVTGWQGLLVTLVVALVSGSALGLGYMLATGRPVPLGADLAPSAHPARRLVLRLAGARGPAAPDAPVQVWPGTGLLVRLATGESSIPFGPFLALGAAVAVFVPGSVAWIG